MEFKIKTANFWKKSVIISTFFIVASPQLLESTILVTPSVNLIKNMTCEFTILNPKSVKRMLDQFVLVESADLVFFNIEVNQDFLDETAYDNIHENGILRWIWVSKSKTNILSYPVDLDGITLQLTKSTERTIDVIINATSNLSNYSICISSLYQTLADQLLDRNSTDWKFCHRYFKGQQWKHAMNEILGSWLGYDFECFNTFCSDIECADIVEKGTVNIVIDIFIFLLCINLPLFYLFLPKRQNISSNHYYNGDSPYSFARLFLHLNKNTQTVGGKKCKTFPEWLQVLAKDSSNLNPEAKVLSFFYFVLLGVFYLQTVYLRRAIADYDKYVDIFQPIQAYSIYLYVSDDILLNICLFTTSFFIILPVLLIFMSYYGQSENTFFSFYPFGITTFDEIDKQQDSSIEYTGYTQFANKFLTRISFFFKKKLWIRTFSMKFFLREWHHLVRKSLFFLYISLVTPLNIILYVLMFIFPMVPFIFDCFVLCPLKYFRSKLGVHCRDYCGICMTNFAITFMQYLYFLLYFVIAFRPYFLFVTQFVFRLIVYTIFVAGPLFSISETSYQFWAISLAASVYILKYTITFNSNYKYLLEKVLKFKHNAKDCNCTRNTAKVYQSENSNTEANITNVNVNSSRQAHVLVNEKNASVPVELFDQIAREIMPLRIQLLILFLKLFFTGIFLYVTFDSISKGGNAGFLTSQIPLIITVVMPAIAERLCSTSNKEDVIKMNEENIKLMIKMYDSSTSKENGNGKKVKDNLCLPPQFRWVSKHFAVIFPIIYTCKCVFTSIFFCCKECEDVVDVGVASENANSIRDGRDRGSYTPL